MANSSDIIVWSSFCGDDNESEVFFVSSYLYYETNSSVKLMGTITTKMLHNLGAQNLLSQNNGSERYTVFHIHIFSNLRVCTYNALLIE